MLSRLRVVLSAVAACALATGGALVLGVPTAQAAPVVVTTPDALADAFANGTPSVQLGADMSLSALEVPDGGAITLDLNGHALSVDNTGGSGAAIEVSSGSALTVEDTSAGARGTLTAASALGAGIGGGNGGNASAGTVTITGGTVTATSEEGAGIGGGNSAGSANGGTVTISGGTVTATGGAAAGIGGGNGGSGGSADGGTVSIKGGTVTATGNSGGAGIGGGSSPSSAAGGTVEISGGTVTATGSSGAGIGGGNAGETAGGGTVSITGGTVTATGNGGAGVGGGTCSGSGPAAGAALVVDADGTLTASGDRTAIGPGTGVDSPNGSFDNVGHVTVAAGEAVFSKAQNFGLLHNKGTISVVDAMKNGGTITGAPPTPLTAVTGNNYTVKTADGATLQILAATAHDAAVSLPRPTQPPPTGKRFAGWTATSSGGKSATMTESTSLPDAFGPGPTTITLTKPVWTALPAHPHTQAQRLSPELIWIGVGAATIVALGVVALLLGRRSRRRAHRAH